MPPKRDLNALQFESSDFPVLCETCLGPNPYIRMSKQDYGAECKICTRPFTVFRWTPGEGMRFKKTEICLTCAKMKNVCQTCLLDLQYGLPTQIRDAAMGNVGNAPTEEINKAYIAQNMDGKMDGATASSFGKADPATKELLKRLARSDPNYNKNRPKPCSFYQRGECNRGDACPYRHDIVQQPMQSVSTQQSIQDRYHGRNDPVARKILEKAAKEIDLSPPSDESITSLFLSQLPSSGEISVEHIRSTLPTSLSTEEIKSINLVPNSKCAFINFSSRKAAEEAALHYAASAGQLKFQGIESSTPVKIAWGRARKAKQV